MVEHHLPQTPSLEQSNYPCPITISPRFKELLRKEFHSLIEEWNWAPVRRRREIVKVCGLIIGIIDGVEEQR